MNHITKHQTIGRSPAFDMYTIKGSFSALISLIFLISLTPVLSAQENKEIPTAERVRSLNNDLLRLHGSTRETGRKQIQTKSAADVALRGQAYSVLQERAAALSKLMEENPQEALSMAFSPDLVADLAAAFPESAAWLEKHGTWQGPVERWIYDNADLKTSRTVTRMKVGEQSLEVHFATPEPADLTSGSVLQAEGVQLGNKAVLNAASVQTVSATTQTCSTTGVQNTVVLMVLFPGTTPPSYLTPQSVSAAFFGTTGRSLDAYWREASYGKTSATGNVFGWYTLSSASYLYMDDLLFDAINIAGKAGVNFQNYSRLFLVAPDFGGYWAGLANFGCTPLNSPTGSFNASVTYINGTNWMNNTDDAVKTIAHEGGHNLGLNHSNSRAFGAEALGPLGTAGTITNWGDQYSVMTNGALGQYTAPHKVELLNWISPSNYQTVQSSGTWTLQPYENAPAGLQALKIQRGTGNNAWLWVEYRQPIGNYDITYVNNYPQWYPWANQVFSGAVIHYEDSLTTGAYSHLLDFTPTSTSGFLDPALAAGQTWVDPYSNLSITVQSATPSGMTISATYGGATPCTHANPTVSMSPANPSVSAGSNVNYTVSVTNNDSSGCSASTFGLASTQPSGWSGAFSSASLTANPGQTASATLTETVPANATAGTYTLSSSAASGSYTGSGTANATVAAVASSLTDATAVSGSSYKSGQTVPVTATVQSGSTPAAGASVTFTLTKANGNKVTGTTTADSSGKATWSYKVGPKDPTGSYSVMNNAGYKSQTVTSNSAAFTVQ